MKSTLLTPLSASPAINFRSLVALFALAVVLLSGCSANRSSSFSKVAYAGISGNISQLEPDTSNSDIFSLAESSSGGAGVILGFDLSERLSSEIRYTDLGSAELAPQAAVDYVAAGVSLLYYGLGSFDGLRNRTGFAGFARGGVNLMIHDSGILLDAEDNAQIVAGLGVDYMFANRLALRAEVDFHDVDAQSAHLGLLYRFGGQSGSQSNSYPRPVPSNQPTILRPDIQPAPQAPRQPQVVQAPQPAPLPDISPLPQPRQPQIAQPTVIQPAPLPNAPTRVPANTGRVVNGVVAGVGFAPGSARLNADAFSALDKLATELRQQPSARVELQVHTNGIPGARPAMNLARARALVVGRLLISRGVRPEQVSARAFGANQPRTGAQSGVNERVELVVLSR